MEKLAKVIIGWIVIVLFAFILLMLIYAIIPGGDGTAQLIITGILLIAFMLWMIFVFLEEKLQKLIDQKEIKRA